MKDIKLKDKMALGKVGRLLREEGVLPLLEPARCVGTSWFLTGNRALVSLNLSCECLHQFLANYRCGNYFPIIMVLNG